MIKTNKAKQHIVWLCQSRNKGLSCIDYKERKEQDERLKVQCVHAAWSPLGAICIKKQLNNKQL